METETNTMAPEAVNEAAAGENNSVQKLDKGDFVIVREE
jgi:hypothetical protein